MYIGMVCGGKCGESTSAIITPSAPSVMRVISFQDSPYGFALDFVGSATLTPYLIDATTLEVTLGTPISGPYSGSAGDIQAPYAVLDDSTMVFTRFGPGATASLYTINRSGLSLSINGPQQSVTTFSAPGIGFICRIDSSHITRGYSTSAGFVFDVLSVSGGVISLVHSELIAFTQSATVDGGAHDGQPTGMSNTFYPFHYNGSGTLYAYSSASSGSGTLFGPCILAIPFSIGGGIGGAITLATRARDSQNIQNFVMLPGGSEIGNSEGMLITVTGHSLPFYDDGTHMHFNINTNDRSNWISYNNIGHADNIADTATTQGNYLCANIGEFPPGNIVNTGPALLTQSGESLSYTLISPQFLCPQFGTSLQVGGSARHGSNLGAQIIQSPFNPSGFHQYLVRGYKW